MRFIKIEDRIIGDGEKAFLMAEMSWIHNGDMKIAKEIVKKVAESKFDAINFHLTHIPSYVTEDHTVDGVNKYKYLDKINLTPEENMELVKLAKSLGLFVSVMCNDLTSVTLAQKIEPHIVSVHSTTFLEEELLMKIASLMKPVFLMVGGATLGEIERGISILGKYRVEDYALIDGFHSIPAIHENINLELLNTIKALYGSPVGFADHMYGDSIDAIILPQLAIAKGANIIEKHVTLDRNAKIDGYEAALDSSKLNEFVEVFRRCEKAIGISSITNFTEEELTFREMTKKKTVAVRDIKKGEIITYRDMCFKLSNSGISPEFVSRVIGRRALCGIKKDEGITPEMYLEL